MTDHADRPSRYPWPPVIFVIALAAAILLGALLPLGWIGAPMADILFAIGWLLVAGAIAISVSAIRTMRRHRTTLAPHRPSDHLVTDGPFGFTRNPLYLSNAMVLVGIGLIVANLWFVVAALAGGIATTVLAIRGEERHLAARFGKRYRDYAKKVRRWI